MAESDLKDKEFVESIVKEIVNHPEEVKVERKLDEMGVLLTLSVHPEDMGQVIGKEGRTAKAIRTLLRVLGAKDNARLNLKILEPEGSTRGPASATPVEPQPEAENLTTPLEEKATEVV